MLLYQERNYILVSNNIVTGSLGLDPGICEASGQPLQHIEAAVITYGKLSTMCFVEEHQTETNQLSRVGIHRVNGSAFAESFEHYLLC